MAKKKVEEQDGEIEIDHSKLEEKLQKEIEKEYGKGIIVSAQDLIERPPTIIPFAPVLDQIIGGGVPEGSWMNLSGEPKCGKSVSTLHFCAKAQQVPFEGRPRKIFYGDVEGRIKKRDLEGIKGLDINAVRMITSTADKTLSAQEYLDLFERILKNEKGCVLVIDSVSALNDEREMNGGIGTETRGGGSKLLKQFTRMMANVVSKRNHIVVSIIHLIANTSGYGETKAESGGNGIKYQADIRLRARTVEKWPKEGDPIGQKVNWECLCSALGPPFRKGESYIRYGEGIDETMEIIQLGSDVGLIEQGGAWYTLSYMKNHPEYFATGANPEGGWPDDKELGSFGVKYNGMDRLRQGLIDRPELFQILNKDVKEFFS